MVKMNTRHLWRDTRRLKPAGIKDQVKDLAKRAQCDYLEIRIEDSRTASLQFMGDSLESVNEQHSGGAAIRALVNGCWGFVTFNDLDTIERGVAQAIAAARTAASVAKGGSSLAPVVPVDVAIGADPVNDPREISLRDKVELFARYNDRVLSAPGVTSSRAYYFDTASRVLLVNSEGTCVDRERIDLACSVSAIATRDGETRAATVSQGSSNDYNVVLGLEQEIDRRAREAVAMLDAPVIKAGSYTVVCDPHLAGVFIHEAFGHLSEGDNLADDPAMQEVMKLGRVFGKPFLNAYDTGLDVGLRGYIPVDDEGVPTQRTQLIQEGRLVGRLHSRETAGKLGERATGNARAISFRHPPIPRMRNTCISPGPHGSFQDLIKDVKLGVYALDSGGGQTNGELFTFTARDAFMIREGKLAERVKDVTICGNVFDTLASIDAVSSDFEIRDSAGGCGKAGQMPLPVSHGSPHIRIRDCVIGGQ